MTVPGSQKHTIARFGNNHVNGDLAAQTKMNLQVMLDYRCHVKGGVIGHEFPPKMSQCLADITSSRCAAHSAVSTRPSVTHELHGHSTQTVWGNPKP